MATVHQKLAVVIVLVALGGFLWSAYLLYKRRSSARIRQLAVAVEAMVCLQAVFGILLAITGSRPAESLHFLYGPATVLSLPVAALAGRGRTEREARLFVTGGWLAILLLSLRAVGTGGAG